MALKAANNACTTLNGAVSIGQTTIIVVSSIAFPLLGPSDFTYATLISLSAGFDPFGNPRQYEIVKVLGPLTPGADTMLNVIRAQDDSVAGQFIPGDICDLRINKAYLLGGGSGGGTVTNVSGSGTADISVNVTNPTTTPNVAVALLPTGVTPGFYPFATIMVDVNGRITAAVGSTAVQTLTSPDPALSVAPPNGHVVINLNDFIGDSGAGGQHGAVPAPAAGDAAANKFLKADGTWATTPGGGGNALLVALIGGIF